MGRLELPVLVNNISDLSTKFRSLTWTTLMFGINTLSSTNIYIYIYNKIKYGVNIQVSKTTISGKIIKLEINTNPLHAVRGGRGFLWQTNCHALGQTPRLNSY